jgi:hypothetical protein
MDRGMNRAKPILSPLLWSARRRVTIAASMAAGLWLLVGWALDWWK